MQQKLSKYGRKMLFSRISEETLGSFFWLRFGTRSSFRGMVISWRQLIHFTATSQLRSQNWSLRKWKKIIVHMFTSCSCSLNTSFFYSSTLGVLCQPLLRSCRISQSRLLLPGSAAGAAALRYIYHICSNRDGRKPCNAKRKTT